MNMQFENKFDAMMHIIYSGKHSDLDIERLTGISRTQAYRWRSGETKKVQDKTFTAVMDAMGVDYEINANGILITKSKKDNKMQNEIIAQQLRHIEMLENQIKELTANKPDCPEFIDMDYDYRCIGEFYWESGILFRKIIKLEGADFYIKKLNIPEKIVQETQFYEGGIYNAMKGYAYEGLTLSTRNKIKTLWHVIKDGMFNGNPPPYITTLTMTPHGNGHTVTFNCGISVCLDDCKTYDAKLKFIDSIN